MVDEGEDVEVGVMQEGEDDSGFVTNSQVVRMMSDSRVN